MRAFTSRAANFFTSRSASALVLYAASWMVHVPRGVVFVGALVLAVGFARGVGALAGFAVSARDVGFVASVRDVATADSGSSTLVRGVEVLGDFVASGALPVVRVAGFTAPPDCTGAARDAPVGAALAIDGGVVAGGDVLTVWQ